MRSYIGSKLYVDLLRRLDAIFRKPSRYELSDDDEDDQEPYRSQPPTRGLLEDADVRRFGPMHGTRSHVLFFMNLLN